ncbi:MAG: hypothetical protein WBC40_02860, partial [Halobacteriota archaeon]
GEKAVIKFPFSLKSKRRLSKSWSLRIGFSGCSLYNSESQVIKVFVQIRALQEDGISPEEFIKEHDCDEYILLCLRIKGGHRNPDGLKYIEKFRSHGWNIKDICVLGKELRDLPLPHDISAYPIKDSKSMPANEIAYEIRERWGWL